MANGHALVWRGCDSGHCVQVAQQGEQVLIRASEQPAGPYLAVSRESWTAFVTAVRDGEFEARHRP